MTTFLDARTSQNASTANSIAIPILVVDTPQLFGQVGLNLFDAPAGTAIEVQFSGVIAVQLPLALVGITITVVRGTLSTDPVVFSQTPTFDLSVLAPQTIAFSGSDFNVPLVPNQTYTAFISSNLLGTIRVGPESFNATAYATVETT